MAYNVELPPPVSTLIKIDSITEFRLPFVSKRSIKTGSGLFIIRV